MLGVEPIDKDRDGKPHQIRVRVGRPGLQIRSRRQVQYAVRTPNTWSRDVLMGRVLRSPAPNTELPMRLSSYVYRDAAPGKVKVVLAAEIDPQKMEDGLDLAIGFAIFDRQGAVVASGQERKVYSANSDVPIHYDLTVPMDPGTYRIRLAAIDLKGNSGSVERDVDAFRMEQELAFGDLILTPVPDGKVGEVRPPVVLQVRDGRLGAYTELYTSKPGYLEQTGVVFEVADTSEGPTIQSVIAEVRERPDRTLRQAVAVIPVGTLPPGRYIARAVISSSGTTAAKLTRPFDVLATPLSRKPSPGAPIAPTSAAGAAPVGKPVAPSTPMAIPRVAAFKREDVLTGDMLRAVFDVMDTHHPAAKAAIAQARKGKLEGTALMALDAGDQFAGSILRGLEYLSKGQLDPAGKQFFVALRNAPDGPLASFYLGACFAAAGNDKEAIAAWQRARAAQLKLPGMDVVVADGWLRLGQPAEALEPLQQALVQRPKDDDIRKNLAVAQSLLGLHEQAYPTIVPFLERHPSDADALLVALHALYQVRLEGKTIGSAAEDKARAAAYARAYAEANGPHAPLVEKWAEFLSR
jgi:Flp pilus assembly protein TadD